MAYIPSPQFSITRSYVAGIWFQYNATAVMTHDETVFTAVDGGGTVEAVVQLRSAFYAPSSNHYTLDYVVFLSFYRLLPDPTPIPLPFDLVYYVDPDDGFPYLVFQPFGAPGTGNFKFRFPKVTNQWNNFPWNAV